MIDIRKKMKNKSVILGILSYCTSRNVKSRSASIIEEMKDYMGVAYDSMLFPKRMCWHWDQAMTTKSSVMMKELKKLSNLAIIAKLVARPFKICFAMRLIILKMTKKKNKVM